MFVTTPQSLVILPLLYILCNCHQYISNVISTEVEKSKRVKKAVEISPLHYVSVEMTYILVSYIWSIPAQSRGLIKYILTSQLTKLILNNIYFIFWQKMLAK